MTRLLCFCFYGCLLWRVRRQEWYVSTSVMPSSESGITLLLNFFSVDVCRQSHRLIVSCFAESAESREQKSQRQSRWGSDALQQSLASGPHWASNALHQSPASGPPSLPGQSLPGQTPMGFTPAGMSGYPPPGAPVGMHPPGMMMSPQLGAASVPRPNTPGSGGKFLSVFR